MPPIDVMEVMRGAFRAEAMDLLIELDSSLLALESEVDDKSLVHRVFRAIHTIKGSGATAGCAHLAKFAHSMEEAFNLAREGRLAITPELVDCGLKACDVIRLILEETGESDEVAGELEVVHAFARLLPGEKSVESIHPPQPFGPASERAAYHITLRPKPGMFYLGTDPVTILDELRQLGDARILAHTDQLPLLDAMDPEQCYLWWDVVLITAGDRSSIENVFIFVEDECDVRIRLRDDQADALLLLASVPQEMFETFVTECREHLDAIQCQTGLLEKNPESRLDIEALFRSVHTIKGNSALLLDHLAPHAAAGLSSLRQLVRISRGLESLLDPRRESQPGATDDEAIRLSMEACDAMRMLLDYVTRGEGNCTVPPGLLASLGIPVEAASRGADTRTDGIFAAFQNTATQCIHTIELCLERLIASSEGPDARAATTEIYLRALRTIDTAARYAKHAAFEEPVRLQVQLLTASDSENAALNEEQCNQLWSSLRCMQTQVLALSQGEDSISSMEADVARTPADDPHTAFGPHRNRRLGGRQEPEIAMPPAAASTIRIDQGKLDGLMRIVGELLVARGAFPLMLEELQRQTEPDRLRTATFAKNLKEAGSNISRIADELQRSVMSIRMLPVKVVFQKFPRLVRDLARSLGKECNLVVSGETIELDKTIVEQIGDPLVHVIRNAVDHGLETPEERIAGGKGRAGCLTLRAQHEAGGVSIEVSDDGRGLDANRLKCKAVEKGLLSEEAAAAMNDEAAYQLVFLPGLSTAATVTDVSGRGVGMDVVHSNVRNLQGTIEIRSRRGRGTTFLIKLPTSLMVSKGILLEAGGQQYILPLNSVCDMVKLQPEALHHYGSLALAHVRGSIYPACPLSDILGLAPVNSRELSIAIVEAGKEKYGLVVDRFLTEVEVLVKPLTGGLVHCEQFLGAAILGDGRVVLVLNALGCRPLDASNAVC